MKKYYCSDCFKVMDKVGECHGCGSVELEEFDYRKVKDCAAKWVGEFNAINQSLIVGNWNLNPDNWVRLTVVNSHEYFPMWSTMWTFGTSLDTDWLEDNLDIMENLGFVVFEYLEELNYYIGINGAGYDFYEQHWIPLYLARGIKWHLNL